MCILQLKSYVVFVVVVFVFCCCFCFVCASFSFLFLFRGVWGEEGDNRPTSREFLGLNSVLFFRRIDLFVFTGTLPQTVT